MEHPWSSTHFLWALSQLSLSWRWQRSVALFGSVQQRQHMRGWAELDLLLVKPEGDSLERR